MMDGMGLTQILRRFRRRIARHMYIRLSSADSIPSTKPQQVICPHWDALWSKPYQLGRDRIRDNRLGYHEPRLHADHPRQLSIYSSRLDQRCQRGDVLWEGIQTDEHVIPSRTHFRRELLSHARPAALAQEGNILVVKVPNIEIKHGALIDFLA